MMKAIMCIRCKYIVGYDDLGEVTKPSAYSVVINVFRYFIRNTRFDCTDLHSQSCFLITL